MILWFVNFMVCKIFYKHGNPHFFLLFVLAFLTGCANIVTPTGGDKDTTPPKILKIVPENQSLNFNQKSITISFDEFIQLSDISSQLITSPPLQTQPEFVIKGKNLIVRFRENLLPNTTYTMNFGSAIRDLNENNALENFTYVFSTGNFLDSLFLRGTVKNAFTLENEKDVLFMLYIEHSDSIPYLKPPYYYAKTDVSGNFALNNLKAGKFKAVALKDDNGSFLYDDFEKETIGFMDSLVEPYYIERQITETKDTLKTDSVSEKKGMKKEDDKTLKIYVFKEEKNKQYLKKAFCEHYGKLVFIFNKKPEVFEMNLLNTSFKKEWNITEHSITGDTVTVWLSDVENDSLIVEISDKGTVIDTTFLALKKRSEKIELQSGSGKRMMKETKRFQLELEGAKSNFSHNPVKDFFITFNHPVKSYTVENIVLKEDSNIVKFIYDSEDKAMRKFKIDYGWKEEKKYELIIPAGTITDIFGLKNDSMRIAFSTQAKSFFGNLSVLLKCPAADYILQVTDEKGNTIAEKSSTGNEKFLFSGLEPKNYGLRLIVDENKNGKWDTGNYLQKKQAEKIIIYPQKANVRSNWDVDVEWEIK